MNTTPFNSLLELSNGCVCCSVKNDFVSGLEVLLQENVFDYILLECSGIVDPGPLIELFWLDQQLPATIYLDGVVTVVDSYHLHQNIINEAVSKQRHDDDNHDNNSQTNNTTASSTSTCKEQSDCIIRQIAYADIIWLNKIDLLNDDTFVDILIHDIRRYNQIAPLYQTIKSNVDLSNILYQNLFDATTAVNKQIHVQHQKHGDRHDEHQHHENGTSTCITCIEHKHDSTIRTHVIDITDADQQRYAMR